MHDGELLLRAICETPADDTVRLVYADWLEEHGDPDFAELIRTQIVTGVELTATGGPCQWNITGRYPESESFWKCAGQIELSMRTITLPQPYTVTRGFVSHIELTCAEFMAHAAAIFAAYPVTSVRLTNLVPFLVSDSVLDARGLRRELQYALSGVQQGVPGFTNLSYDPCLHGSMPQDLYVYLPGGMQFHRKLPFHANDTHYETSERAIDDVSRACVTYGRSLAGLRSLTEEKSANAP